jgi:SAM-dependent methyltransferase
VTSPDSMSSASRQQAEPRMASLRVKPKSVHYIHLHLLMQDLSAAIKTYARGDLLDLGCGNRPYDAWYVPRTTSQTGCDITQSDQQRVDVICAASRLPFASGSFDTVLCTQVLEHVYDQRELIADAYRVLRKDGCLILTVPFCWEIHEAPYDFFRVTKYGLKKMLEDAGFQIVEIKANGGKWATAAQMMLNTIYSSFKTKSIRARLMKLVFHGLRLTWLINKLALWIDRRYFDDTWTLNYLVVAKK